MHDDLNQAIHLLCAGNYTCVLYCQGTALTDTRRGIRPLLDLMHSNQNLQNFCAADRVVGKAAAFLYSLMRVRAVYAQVISAPAIQILSRSGIHLQYETQVPAIQNRSQTGLCPIETAVWDIEEPMEALAVIQETLAKL